MRILPAILLWCFSAVATAEPLQDLKQFYAEVSSLEADFEQRLLDEDGETLERYVGRLWLQRPGRFFWRYDSPYPLELGSDGETLWHYDIDLKQITLRDAKSSLGGTPAELLGGDVAELKQYELQRLADAEGLEWLRLSPRDPDSDFSAIRIGMQAGQPRLILLSDRLGQSTEIKLHDLRGNQSLSPEKFELRIPDAVTVVDERAPS